MEGRKKRKVQREENRKDKEEESVMERKFLSRDRKREAWRE